MDLEVTYLDEHDKHKTIEGNDIEEGEQGLKVIGQSEHGGRNVVGYIPYSDLKNVTPKQ